MSRKMPIEQSDSLKRLAELTPKLPGFPQPVGSFADFQEFHVEQGSCLGSNLFSSPYVSVARWFLSKDTKFQRHVHTVKEWIIVTRGSIYIKYMNNGKEEKAQLAQSVIIESGVEHECRTDEDCWCICVTVPQCPEYPAPLNTEISNGNSRG